MSSAAPSGNVHKNDQPGLIDSVQQGLGLKGEQTTAHQDADKAKHSAAATFQQTKDAAGKKLNEFETRAEGKAGRITDNTQQQAKEAENKAASTFDQLSKKVDELTQSTRDNAKDAQASARGTADQLGKDASAKADRISHNVGEQADQAAGQGATMYEQAKQVTLDTLEATRKQAAGALNYISETIAPKK